METHLTAADAAMLEEVTGVPLAALLDATVAAGAAPADALAGAGTLLEAALSPVRFIPHALNARGLHLLRVLLAERMDDARRAALPPLPADSAEEAGLAETWARDGVLRLDFARYTSSPAMGDAVGNERFNEVLRHASASRLPVEALEFVRRAVRHLGALDPQCALHCDTFHGVVKLWVYDANVTRDHGPLHVVGGSHRASLPKLRWLFARTRDSAPSVVSEPSIRFDDLGTPGELAAAALEQFGLPRATAVLPLPGVARTLVIADTSALHCRGLAAEGTTRFSLRPMGAENDGGVPRDNPFRLSD